VDEAERIHLQAGSILQIEPEYFGATSMIAPARSASFFHLSPLKLNMI
jgi:hypothetical protein